MYELLDEKEWVCSRKRKFKKEEWADNWLADGIASGHYTQDYHVYVCPFCFSYHIGRKPKNEQYLPPAMGSEETSSIK